jgi:hypothetical protein
MRAILTICAGLLLFVAACSNSGGGYYTGDCIPVCEDHECGDDECGGSCGNCQGQLTCLGGYCSDKTLEEIRGEDLRSPYDLYTPDADKGKICLSFKQQYEALLEGAGECTHALDCSHLVMHKMECSCAEYVSDASVEASLTQVVAAFDQMKCMEGEGCGACPWSEVPDCVAAVCAATLPSCDVLAEAYTGAVEIARQCEQDEDCTVSVAQGLDCGCQVPVHKDTWLGYFEIAEEYWNGIECGGPDPCDCVELENVACLGGLCALVETEPPNPGSTECDEDEQCIAVSGCACGCWSVPPEDNRQECPCAAPAACGCLGEECVPVAPE